jgi:hypothetical protein
LRLGSSAEYAAAVVDDDTTTLQDLQDRVRERAAAYLTVYSETEAPNALATAIGLEPDESWRQDEPRGRLKKPARANAVEYGSLLDEHQSPNAHVSALAKRLRPYAGPIRALCAEDTTWAIVRVVEHANGLATEWFGNVEVRVEPEDLQTFAALGAGLFFDAYVGYEDD